MDGTGFFVCELCVTEVRRQFSRRIISPEGTKVGGVENFRLPLKPSLARRTGLNLRPELFCFRSVFTRIFPLSSHSFCSPTHSAAPRLIWSPPPTTHFLSAKLVSRVTSYRLVGQSSGRTSKCDSGETRGKSCFRLHVGNSLTLKVPGSDHHPSSPIPLHL